MGGFDIIKFIRSIAEHGIVMQWAVKQTAGIALQQAYDDISQYPFECAGVPALLQQVIDLPTHRDRQEAIYNNASMDAHYHGSLWWALASIAQETQNEQGLVDLLKDVQTDVRHALVRGPAAEGTNRDRPL